MLIFTNKFFSNKPTNFKYPKPESIQNYEICEDYQSV